MSTTPILHPETQRLTDENALLREELTGLLTEAEQLVGVVKPNLLALYQTPIGVWELRLLQAQCATARLRREVELIQASLNRGEPPDLRAIEGELELEFLRWQQVREAAERVQAAEHRLQHLLPPEADRELKKLYYALVKRLHPDVNPHLSEAQHTLWRRVQSAYAASDVDELRALALLAERAGAAPPSAKGLEALRAERATLSRQITEQRARIEKIQSQPPFTLRAQLDDETWLTARRDELEQQFAQSQTQRAALAAHRQKLLLGGFHGHNPGQN